MRRASLTIVVAIAGAVFVVAAAREAVTRRGSPTVDSTEARVLPQVAPAERGKSSRIIATGSVRLAAGARIEVGAQISGKVRTLAVTQGSRVEAGQVIAQLDTSEARALVDQASAQVEELTAAERQAADQARRTEALAAVRGVTQQELVAAQATAAQATARLGAARSALQLARIRLEYTTVRAPITGVVASVTTHEGETVAASLSAPTFVTLIDPAKLECVALVDETDIGRVAPGDSAEFTVDAYPGRAFRGVVARIAPDASIVGGVVDYEVTLRLLGNTHGLKPQMTTSVTITHPRSQSAVRDP